MSIGIMNVIVGVIVESTLDSARVIDQQVEREETAQQIQRMDNIQTLLATIDSDSDGMISACELQKVWGNPEVKRILGTLNIPKWFSPEDLLILMDQNGDGYVHCEEFASSFIRLLETDAFHNKCADRRTKNLVRQLAMNIVRRLIALADGNALLKQSAVVAESATQNATLPLVENEFLGEVGSKLPLLKDPCDSPPNENELSRGPLPVKGEPAAKELERVPIPSESVGKFDTTSMDREQDEVSKTKETPLRLLLERIDRNLSAPAERWRKDEALKRIEARIGSLEKSVGGLTTIVLEEGTQPSWNTKV